MQETFRTVGVGGTFDELHRGHRALLMKAFQIGQRVIIGVSSDEFARRMKKPHKTASYAARFKELRSFLMKHGFLERAEIISIDDPSGGVLLSNGPIEALVVSQETEATALKINEKRMKAGLAPLHIVVINMVPSENHSAISTTRIRGGEIDREGHLLKSLEK
jgi:cytidyltransferase-like protein